MQSHEATRNETNSVPIDASSPVIAATMKSPSLVKATFATPNPSNISNVIIYDSFNSDDTPISDQVNDNYADTRPNYRFVTVHGGDSLRWRF